MVEKVTRETVRQAYGHRCGYCGVHEEEVGSELEIDHFQPRAAGGDDDLDNLVYCCPTCNRFKGDFWSARDLGRPHHRLLHPKQDDPSVHIREEDNGRLTALTERSQSPFAAQTETFRVHPEPQAGGNTVQWLC